MVCGRIELDDFIDGFPVSVGMRPGCVMSPWVFSVYLGGMMKEVKEGELNSEVELPYVCG